jgi:hypothetical protein
VARSLAFWMASTSSSLVIVEAAAARPRRLHGLSLAVAVRHPHDVADETDIAQTFVNMLAGIVSRDPTVAMRAAEVDGAITVTLTLRAPAVHRYPDRGTEVRLAAGDSITFAVQDVKVGAPAGRS